MAVDRSAYRDAMARLGAAVNVITTADTTARHGFTASAVCSVTDEPPTLLVCMNRSSRTRPAFAVGGALCVNVLAANQQEISVAFASRSEMEERFAGGRWTTLATGAPVLEEAVASFDSRITQVVEIGTHDVMFCVVEAIRMGEPRDALIYLHRTYHNLPPALLGL
ncbi:flavin reductase [Rhizosaccharibacter radicis]|uniref:Flavin reductase n=1 Tax=Rhizosaccharibacter radicis TaxID=2782605 RepID=A0ABT1W3H6_9PROT|nr:flavin reductase [Acetobacteraceae bacterium KSS12]